MAIKVETKNPLISSGGNLLSPNEWISRILFVAWIGAIFAIGSKVLTTADKYIPGSNTPTGMANATVMPAPGESVTVF